MTVAFPLTPIQEGMFLETAQAANPGIYLQQIIIHMADERIDATAMGSAWSDAFIVHPALRLVIKQTDPLVQSLEEPQPLTVNFLDWTKDSSATQQTKFENFLAGDRAKGTAAERYPSSRFTLVKTGARQGKLVWTFPHSLLDGRSVAPILTEAFDRYRTYCAPGPTPQTPPLPTKLVFAEHCDALSQLDQQPGLDHFAGTLQGWEGGSGLLNLDAEPAPRAFYTEVLTKEATRALEDLAAQAGVAMSTLVMAAWGVVTARFSGRGDTVFGNTLAGRHLVKGMQDAVGCFLTTVPMRLKLTPGQTIGDILSDMRTQQIDLRPFEQTPLTKIRARTDVPPGVPLFDTVVVFETTTLDAQLKTFKNGWENRTVDLREEGSTPATLAVYHGEQVKLAIEYDPQQVPDGPRVAKYMQQFLRNLVTATPDTPIAAISMLSRDEIQSLYQLSGEKTARANTPRHCLTLFADQVTARPGHVAVCQDGAETLSYGALDAAANRLAHTLVAQGVLPRDIVGICLSRSPAFAVAILAVWKAGAAFVPMDPSYPRETLDIIETDSDARLIITDDSSLTFNRPVLNLSQNTTAQMPDTAPDIAHQPDDPAYVIFTSGSTGRPKGVLVPQSALAAHAAAAQNLYQLTPDDRALQFASLSFDVALEECVSTLLAGATLVMRTPDMSQSTSVFLERCTASGITLLNLPTGFWVALTDAMETGKTALPDTIRMIIVGGERIPLSVLRRWRAMFPDLPFVNGYGPTETTITCTAHVLTPGDLERGHVPIGSPLNHAAAWVLSADGALAPQGTEGELWISGPAVASGYIHRPDITAERFITPDFDPTIGRSYATGDRVVWNEHLLNYIGRTDRQIKLRGFRIEPGQIEQVIEAHADVARAHIAVHEPAGAPQRLMAWYSSADPANPVLPETLTARITAALPAHMRPTLVHIDHWPQTPGGKIDTPKLPLPDRGAPQAEAVEIDTPLVHDVAKLFGQILKLKHVAPNASFYDLGGDSLLLLRLLALLEEEFGVRVKPVAIYAEPTPIGVVKALGSDETDPLVIIPIQPHGTAPPLYAVHVLGNNGSFFRPLAKELGTSQPLFGLTVGLLSDDTPTTVEDIARFYLDQIDRHQPEGPVSLVAVSAGCYVTFELAQQLTAAGRTLNALVFLDSTGPGGRPRAKGLEKLVAHARLFTRRPGAYVRKTFTTKFEERRHSSARKKLMNEDGQFVDANSIAAFVAANTLSIERYKPEPYSGRITVIRAGHDLFDTAEARNTGLGWGVVAAGGLVVYEVPGEHLTMLEQPYVPELARCIAIAIKGGTA